MATAQNIVDSAYKLRGSPYRTWYPGASLPMWLDDYAGDPPPLAHLQYYGVMCSDLINWALEDNGLPAIGGTVDYASALVNASDFDPNEPGEAGAIALAPYELPAVGFQGHVAIYVDEHTLIQALHTNGVTDQYTDTETYSWGGDTAFTIYGFLPGVDYGDSTTPVEQPALPNWFGVGADDVVRLGGDWHHGWLSQDVNGNLKYHAEFQED